MKNKRQDRNLIPLISVVGIVAAPMLLVIGIAIGSQFQLSNSLTADSISSWVSALATVAIAILTFVLAKETWYLREAQIEQVNELRRENIRPNVSIALLNSPISFNLMNMEVSNLGKGIARNIRFKFFDKSGTQIEVGKNGLVDEFLKLHILSDGMHSLGIGQKVSSFVFSFFDLQKIIAGEDIFSPYFKIAIAFEDTEGNTYENELIVDFAEFKGITEIGGGDPIHKISDDIKKLREEIVKWTGSSSNRLNVNTYNEQDRENERVKRDKWRAKQRDRHEQSANK
ncbi:MAG: hypothetical protein JAY84_17125 [Candidatus Thiodiazotropha taylori]|nr:hypothetical protein [Candidatus Thiodiazotropha taylori]